jgi:phosphonopyruvate decarboxylase
VPDSLLSELSKYIELHKKDEHVIASSEGSAIALALGYHLATKNAAAVYLQNSGLGNCINPLISLADKEIYSIPMCLIIGWRGEPNVKDEPQHIVQGRVTLEQLKLLNIPYIVVEEGTEVKTINNFLKMNSEHSRPYAIVVKKGTFEKTETISESLDYELSREEAIKCVVDNTRKEDLFVSTTGKASRELYEYKMEINGNCNDFLTVGGMGHAISIATGIKIKEKEKRIICIDGDGANLMHMGSIVAAANTPGNLVHILINNFSHESVGGQETMAKYIDYKLLSKSVGYKYYYLCENKEDIVNALSSNKKNTFIEIRTNKICRSDLGRPKESPLENKNNFMKKVSDY